MSEECRDLRDGHGRREGSAVSSVVETGQIEYGTQKSGGDTCVRGGMGT
jgi:hypothetical protein